MRRKPLEDLSKLLTSQKANPYIRSISNIVDVQRGDRLYLPRGACLTAFTVGRGRVEKPVTDRQ